MAGNGITIKIASDTREYDQGVRKGMVAPVEDAQAALDDLARGGTEAGTKLEGAFRGQQRSTDELEQHITQLNRSIRTQGQQSTRAVEANAKDQSRAIEEGAAEAKDSLRSNAIETAASFDGSFSSIAGGAQGLLSELTAGFGPGGVLVGLLAAGAIGVITNLIDNQTAAAEADKQAVSDLTQQYIAAGSAGKRSFEDTTQAIKDMTDNTGQNADVILSLQTAWDESKRAGADYFDVVQSIAQADPESISAALKRVQALKDQVSFTGKLGSATAELGTTANLSHLTQQAAVQSLIDALKKAKNTATDAGRAQELAAKAGVSDLQLQAGLVEQLGGAYQDSAGAVDDYLDKESGVFNTAKYIRAMEKRRTALLEYRRTLAESDLDPAARAYIEAQGADQAAAMLQGYKHATPNQRRQLNEIWRTSGSQSADSYLDALGRDLKSRELIAPPIKIRTPSKRELQAAIDEAQRYVNRHPLQGGAIAYTRNGKPLYG